MIVVENVSKYYGALPAVTELSFEIREGETFGLSLYEAMASGCACVAIEHEGNRHLRGTIPLVEGLDEALETIEGLQADEAGKEQVRRNGLGLVNTQYRFDVCRQRAVSRLLKGT